jgi:hypothetical protein
MQMSIKNYYKIVLLKSTFNLFIMLIFDLTFKLNFDK